MPFYLIDETLINEEIINEKINTEKRQSIETVEKFEKNISGKSALHFSTKHFSLPKSLLQNELLIRKDESNTSSKINLNFAIFFLWKKDKYSIESGMLQGPFLPLQKEDSRSLNLDEKDTKVYTCLSSFRRRLALKDLHHFIPGFSKTKHKSLSLLKLEIKEARSILQALKSLNGLVALEKKYEFHIVGKNIRLFFENPFPFLLQEKVVNFPGFTRLIRELFSFLQHGELLSNLNSEELKFKMSFILDRFFQSDSKIYSLLSHLMDLVDSDFNWQKSGLNESIQDLVSRQNSFIIADDSPDFFPFELLPSENSFLCLEIPVLRGRFRPENLMSSQGLTKRFNNKGNFVIFVNPDGAYPLEAAMEEADFVYKMLAASGKFRRIRLISHSIGADEFYRILHGASFIYYIGHGLNGNSGPEIELKNEILPLAQIQSLRMLPVLFFFSACLPPIEDNLQGSGVFQQNYFPALQAVYPLVNIKDKVKSFSALVLEELLAGQNLGQAVLRTRRKLFLTKDASWAMWQVSGSSHFRLEGLRHYNHLA